MQWKLKCEVLFGRQCARYTTRRRQGGLCGVQMSMPHSKKTELSCSKSFIPSALSTAQEKSTMDRYYKKENSISIYTRELHLKKIQDKSTDKHTFLPVTWVKKPKHYAIRGHTAPSLQLSPVKCCYCCRNCASFATSSIERRAIVQMAGLRFEQRKGFLRSSCWLFAQKMWSRDMLVLRRTMWNNNETMRAALYRLVAVRSGRQRARMCRQLGHISEKLQFIFLAKNWSLYFFCKIGLHFFWNSC